MTTTPLNEQEEHVWRRIAMLQLLLPRALEDDLQRGAGISLTHYAVLMHLSEAPDRRLRMSDLAMRATISPSRMTRIVDSLEGRGWVTRSGSPYDGRANLAQLTDAGLTRLQQAWPTHLASARRLVLDHLEQDQLSGVAEVLQQILDTAVTLTCEEPGNADGRDAGTTSAVR
ncbi:MAG: MarR family transcriptional regulator [Marmoricola sp.]